MSVQIKGVGTIGGIDQGLNTTGVITATSFVGSGANLTNLPAQATIANNADNRIITGGSGVNLNAEANVLYDGTNFGIGKSPSRTLDVQGKIRSSDSVCFGDNSSTPSEGVAIHRPAASTLALVTNNTERLRITNAGIIGIGTDAPYTNGLLHCDGHLVLTAAGNAPKIIFDEYGTGTDPKAQIEMDQESSTAASMRFYTEASGTLSERLRITSTGEVKQYGFTGSTDTAVDDLVIGNTDSGTNRGMTIWSHNNQNGGIAFADNDSNFRGAIQYQHAQDRLRFIAEGEEVGMWSNQRGLMVGPTSTGDSVTSKGGAKLYHLCGATPLNGTYNSSTETPLMRCGHSFNGIFQMWMLFNGDECHKGCRQEIIMCQGTYGYVSNSVRREHNQNALGAGLNSMDFAYQNSGSPNYYFKVTATWASGQNQPYILWSWTGHNSEYPYAL